MSGPKYTDFIIERQRLLIIKAQLEAEIEKAKCIQITEAINDCIKNIDLFFQKINIQKFENNISKADEVVKNKTLIEELKTLIEELKTYKMFNTSITGDSKALTAILNTYQSNLKRSKNISSIIKQLIRELNEQYNEQMQENLEMDFETTNWDTNIKISSISQILMDTYTGIIKQLADCEDFENEKAKYDAIMGNHNFDDNFKISQMKMKFDSYLVEKQSSADNEEILKLRSEYIALSNLIYGQCEKIPDDIDVLRDEIAEMYQYSEKQKVGEYVAGCIDNVMQELGYNVLGNDVLDTQKMTKQHFDYSSDSAITIATSESGAMMLEVVGKKSEDGANGSVSAVKSDMERFCPDYQKVKEGLQQYGVKLDDKKLCPPDEKYVRFVDINKTSSSDRRITARNRKKRLYNE